MLTRDEILKADDIKTEIIDVPEWGGKVMIKMLTGTERSDWDEYVYLLRKDNEKLNLAAANNKLCVMAIVGGDLKRLFTDADIDLLGSKSSVALDRVVSAARKLNGMDKTADLEKNSGSGQSGDSISA